MSASLRRSSDDLDRDPGLDLEIKYRDRWRRLIRPVLAISWSAPGKPEAYLVRDEGRLRWIEAGRVVLR